MTASNEHNNAPAVPQGEPVACLVRQRTLRTRAAIAHDGQDHFSEWSDWYPATLKYGTAVTDPRRNSGPEHLFEMLPLVLAAPAPAVPQTVYLVENRTCLLAYASREDADKAVASMPASVGGGFLVSPVQVFGAPAPAPAVPEKLPSGMATSQADGKWRVTLEFDAHSDADALKDYMLRNGVPAKSMVTVPAQEPAKETFQSRYEREFMERMAGNHSKLTEFCAALESFTHDYQRLYSTYKSYRDMISDLIKERDSLREQVAKPAQEVGLTASEVNAIFDKRHKAGHFQDRYEITAAIIAALRAKGGK